MVTLRRIAQQAGVSIGTVSNVLNSPSSVSVATSAKVLDAMKTLGYKPKARRRPYKDPGIRTGLVGLLCIDMPVEVLQLPFFLKFVASLESQLASRGLQMILAQQPDPQVLPANICADRMDGAFLINYPAARIVPALQRLHTVGVFGLPQRGFDWVTTDASEHGRLAGEYLLGRGHRRLAFLNPQRAHDTFAEFGRSFQKSVASHGVDSLMLEAPEACCGTSLWTQQRYRQILEKLLQQGFFALPVQERPTGMYVANDQIALATYQVLAEHGLRGGIDVEIISNDNAEPFLAGLTPRPATIEPHYEEIACQALSRLLYRIQHPDAPAGAKLLIPPRLIDPLEKAKDVRP